MNFVSSASIHETMVGINLLAFRSGNFSDPSQFLITDPYNFYSIETLLNIMSVDHGSTFVTK